VKGLQLRAARKALRNAGLITEVKYYANKLPYKTVIAQSPKPGQTVKRGTHVLINVSLGPTPQQLKAVPDVTGEAEQQARADLQAAGFVPDVQDFPTTDQSQSGLVVQEDPPGGSKAPAGSDVTIYIGRYSAGG
jgi:serine/threonine-protein kinase